MEAIDFGLAEKKEAYTSIDALWRTFIGTLLCQYLNEETKKFRKIKENPLWAVDRFARRNKFYCKRKIFVPKDQGYGADLLDKYQAEKFIFVMLGKYHFRLIYRSNFLFFFEKRWILLTDVKKEEAAKQH